MWTQDIIKAWEKRYSRVDISWLILNYKKETLCVQFFCQQLYSSSYVGLDHVLEKLKCASKLSLALGFILTNIEDGKFRYFYAHENNTLLEQSKLVSNKNDMAKLKKILNKTNVIESCTKDGTNTKWRFLSD